MAPKVFLLSPAKSSGARAGLLLNERAGFPLAARMRAGHAPIGEVYSFLSGLYFRGKIAYAEAFAAPPSGVPASLVITPGYGLVPPATPVTLADLRHMAKIPVDAGETRFIDPLIETARLLDRAAGHETGIVLLGSIASGKYVDPLLQIFGDRLLFPSDFVGRGDMSRGGLMLRCARERIELPYVPVTGAVRHGKRPPRLPKPGQPWKL